MIKGIVGSIFSGEAGKNMGAAVANFYKELKASGMPDEAALKMTQDYAKTFSDLGTLIREAVAKKTSEEKSAEEE